MKLGLTTCSLTEMNFFVKGIKVKHSKDDKKQPNRENKISGRKRREGKAAIY